MKFGNLFYLIFLWIIPVLFIFYLYALRKRQRLLEQFASIYLLPRLVNYGSKRIYYLKAFLILLACACGIIALTEPKYGFKWEEISRRGVDIVVAVDVSKSMLAEDIKPNRLERAKRKLRDLLGILEGDRVGLVAFAGTSFLQCPLTLDYEAFQIFLDYLEPSLIPVAGTSLTNALETAVKAFPKEGERSKSIILITDGEDQEKAVENIIPSLKEKGIRVFAIGIGKEEGAPIPTEQGEFKKDENGNVILTKLDPSTLKTLAARTNGSFVRSVSGDIDIQRIYRDGIKAAAEDKDFKTSRKKVWQERFQLFIGLGLLFLCLELLLTGKKKAVSTLKLNKKFSRKTGIY